MSLLKPEETGFIFLLLSDKKRQIIFIDPAFLIIIIFPDKAAFFPVLRECILRQKRLVFEGCIHIENKQSSGVQIVVDQLKYG